ncbi:DNA-directed RNA polymerase I subunit RPA49 [Trichomycterus rosablanca]|uniref:DNA-directed RNA polymerase I subunit RPA49 n=1 Tax=Trichomycterus rosablanca TaxID=2290929 RepID=UPI002F3578FD
MAATCTWKPCEESGEDGALVVRFSNGRVNSADRLDIKLLRHQDGSNPRKKSRRIVVAESDRLSYVGSNFGPGAMQCNNLSRYFVGVLDKTTMQMKVKSAQLFHLQPVVPGEKAANVEQNENKTFREKVDALIEAFGTTKQKRALSSRRMNQVGNDTLQKAVAQAASDIIEQKGLEALQQEVADSQAQTESAPFLPPCDRTATQPEDVYPLDELLSSAELESLKQLGEKMAGLDSTDQKTKDLIPSSVSLLLKCLPKEGEARDRRAACAWYLAFLIRLAKQKKLERTFGEDECPRAVFNKVQRTFTVDKFANGRLRSTVTHSTLVKIASHCLALLLHVGDQTADITLLHRDLAISESRMMEVAKAMGLKLSRLSLGTPEETGLQDEHRTASLELPLVCYERRNESRKRKKMQ